MAKLNQIIAIEKGIKTDENRVNSDLYKLIQKPELFGGLDRTYQPLADDGTQLPAERKRVQQTSDALMRSYATNATSLMRVTGRKDWTNMAAKADVIVDGTTIIKDAPVVYLLFLQKQMLNLRAFVAALPVLDSAEDWSKDPNTGIYKAAAVQTHRTEKKVRPIVMYDATDKHPAQTQMITEDELVGHWTTIKQSGAMQATDKAAMLERIDALTQAVKTAREAANMQEEVPSPDVGNAIFTFVMGEK